MSCLDHKKALSVFPGTQSSRSECFFSVFLMALSIFVMLSHILHVEKPMGFGISLCCCELECFCFPCKCLTCCCCLLLQTRGRNIKWAPLQISKQVSKQHTTFHFLMIITFVCVPAHVSTHVFIRKKCSLHEDGRYKRLASTWQALYRVCSVSPSIYQIALPGRNEMLPFELCSLGDCLTKSW